MTDNLPEKKKQVWQKIDIFLGFYNPTITKRHHVAFLNNNKCGPSAPPGRDSVPRVSHEGLPRGCVTWVPRGCVSTNFDKHSGFTIKSI